MSISDISQSQVPLPLLVLIRGLPGSGKSYLSAALQDIFADIIGRENIIALDPDSIDFLSTEYQDHATQLTQEGVDEKLYPYRFLRGKAYQGIAERKIIIWNQAFTNLEIFNKMNENMRLQAEASGVELKTLVVEVSVDPELAKQRIIERAKLGGHGVPEEIFERFIKDYHSYADDGYTTVATRGNDPIEVSTTSVIKTIQTLR